MENGSVRDHFNLDQKIKGTEKSSWISEFTLADDGLPGYTEVEVHRQYFKNILHTHWVVEERQMKKIYHHE